MRSTNTASLLFRFVAIDVLLDVVRFPYWWYSRGTVLVLGWYVSVLRDGASRLALVVLLKNLGRPMFGDYTREGRIISFLVRIVQLLVSYVLFLLWWFAVTLLLFGYLLLLPAAVFYVFYLWSHA